MVDFNLRRLPPNGGSPREVASIVNQLIDGKSDAKGTFTLTASTTTTVISDFRVGADTVIHFVPITSNAAAEIGAGSVFLSSRGDSTFTITHANNTQNDRTFIYTVTG